MYQESLSLMLTGMLFVFIFLSIMVLCMYASSIFFRIFFKESLESNDSETEKIAVAIAVAIQNTKK